MAIRIVRLGTRREPGEGLRLGTVRRPPRGVKKTDFARLDYFDVWLPELAPSAALVASAAGKELTAKQWAAFAARYRREMAAPTASHLLDLVAALSHRTALAAGCYCEDEMRCHRSLLRELLVERGAELA